MALYSIGEVASLCDINPVTLRAWQRRYDLLKPQRTDGGHRLFNDADIDRIREIKRWIETGIQVSKVKNLLSEENPELQTRWRQQQKNLMHYLQNGNPQQLREWIAEHCSNYSARTLVSHLFLPLRRRFQCQQPTLLTLLSVLDGVLISTISGYLSAARKKNVRDALVIGWNTTDATRLWMEAWIASEQGWRVEVLAHPLPQLRPELFGDQTLLVWCGDAPTLAQQQQLLDWRAQGHPVQALGN